MAVTLATLKARLANDVPARNDVPDEGQYEDCCRDAVADYGRRCSNQKMTTIEVVSGTAAYSLPSDFVRLISLESLASPDGVIISASGLVPVSATYEERVTIAGGTITFSPTPTYSASRDLWYAAGHVLDGDEYPDMTSEEKGLVMLKAQALALLLQANKAAAEAWQYAIGDERVNKEKLAASLREQAQALERQYLAAIEAQSGPVGMRARYNTLGY